MPSQVNDKLLRDYCNSVARGEIARSHNIALQAWRLYEERDDLKLAGIWRRAVSSTLYYQGRYGEALIEAERSAEMQPDAYERARSLILVGEISALCVKPSAAFIALGKAEEIARSFRNDAFLSARIYAFRAFAFSSTGDLEQANIDAEKGAELDLQGGRLTKAAVSRNNAGVWLAREGKLKEAEQSLQSALELNQRCPRLREEANICDSLGYVYMLMGRHDDAERLLQGSARIFHRLPNNAELAASVFHLSELHQHMRQYETARDEAARALKLAGEAKLHRLCADANNLLLSLESDLHRYPENGAAKVQRVCGFISNNLHRKLSLTEMARSVYLSPSRLAHLFKAETGTSLAGYIKTARMEKGKELLANSHLSVKEVMATVGLNDESHFVRDFKRRYGLSPTEYRKRLRAGESLAPRIPRVSRIGQIDSCNGQFILVDFKSG